MFPVRSFSRAESRWEDHLQTLTPVEEVEGIRFKREDRFAPLGYGGINGSKLRQCIWLVSEYIRTTPGAAGLISGASVKSPQLSMSTAVARYYGLNALQVIGSTTPEAAVRHENVAIAASLGARFYICRVAYNPELQRTVRKLRRKHPRLRRFFLLEYGIGVSGPTAERIEGFHRLGSEQVRNVPDDVDELYIPAGSCNSCVSILYGVARFRPKALRRVVLFGIGPTRLDFIHQRLGILEEATGTPIRELFHRDFAHHPEVAKQQNGGRRSAPIRLEHYDLHTTGFARYSDEMPFALGSVEFHPTYEGKVMTYLRANAETFPTFWRGERVLFWIVGSKPTSEAMSRALGLGERPSRAERWTGRWT